jgi:hypothetical protein
MEAGVEMPSSLTVTQCSCVMTLRSIEATVSPAPGRSAKSTRNAGALRKLWGREAGPDGLAALVGLPSSG